MRPGMTKVGEREEKLVSLQYLRGLAVIGVLLFHISYLLDERLGRGPWPLVYPGVFGVELFFVLSGFVIEHVHARDRNRPAMIWRYWYNRLVRIYPVYWIITVGVLVVAWLIPGIVRPEKLRPGFIVESLTLLPLGYIGPNPPIVTVAWTLFHEIKFYLFYSLSILLPRRIFISILTMVVVAVFAYSLLTVSGHAEVAWLAFWLHPYNVLFLAGWALAGVWRHHRKGTTKSGLFCAATGFLVFIGLAVDLVVRPKDFFLPWPHAVAGVACTLLVWAAVVLEEKWPSMPLLGTIGNASYAIYLTHIPVYEVMMRLTRRMLEIDSLALAPALAATVVAALVCGLWFHWGVERPLLGWLRFRKQQRARIGIPTATTRR